MQNKQRLAGLFGNFLEHYDNALFGLLAPFLAPLFFPAHDPLTALILAYSMLPLGAISRPLGALVFGWIGDRFGRRRALFLSLLGMAAVTMAMGCLPLHRDIGAAAPFLLAALRLLQGFFNAGEITGGAIFVLEHTPSNQRSLTSSLYDASSIAGILVASGAVAWMSTHDIATLWRVLYWAGGVTALFGVYVRLRTQEPAEFLARTPQPWLSALREHRSALLRITLAAGFSYVTYSLAFTLMNGYVPLVTSLSKSDVMRINTWLLGLDFVLLPCFGALAQRIGAKRLMQLAALFAAATAIPLFSLLDHSSLLTVTAVRFAIVLFGVAFAAPYHAWTLTQVPPEARYRVLSLGYALGSQLIGAPASALCLWLYQQTGWCSAPGIYLAVLGAAAALAVHRKRALVLT